MNIDGMFPSKWLKADDIDALANPETKTAILTMDRVEMAEVGSSQEEKPILYFKGQKMGLVLNVTNARTIKGIYGPNTDAWAGKPIGLFTTEVDMQGKQVLGIRVRIKAPTVTRRPAKPVEEEVFETEEAPF